MSRERTVHYYPPGPVAKAFIKSRKFVKGIRGPFGSGKSTAGVMDLIVASAAQKPGPDGVQRRRTAIIRNTFPELRTTTMNTWFQWVPKDGQGMHWRDQGPPMHTVRRFDSEGRVVFHWEILFIALDNPDDVRKLLSLELSDAWMNEAREMPKAILDGLTGRVGRYPSALEGGCTYPHIILDTNPPDSDHWWYRLAEEDRPDDWEFFSQPSGLSREAENLDWLNQDEDSLKLPVGHPDRKARGRGYYERLQQGKDEDWIKVYIRGEYGFVREGKPVYPEYSDATHCKAFELLPRAPIEIGLDFGLTPAATFGQRAPWGQQRTCSEIVTTRMGVINFANEILRHVAQRYADRAIAHITGDPSGEQGQMGDRDESTVFQILKAHGVEAKPAPTNDPTKRRESVAFYMNQLVDGQPAFLIHPDCKVLRKALGGGYCFKRIQVTGEERYRDAPDKNHFSHVAEADQYRFLGAGEHRTIVKRDPSIAGNAGRGGGLPRFAIMD